MSLSQNSKLAAHVLQKLVDVGVREFCICAGARNAPLVAQLAVTENVQVFSFFEERAASFFALGRTRESGRPVAVIMTSGTAVAECLSAVIEAQYQGLPLMILSADRPRSYRGSGAPQSIDQVGIFASSVESCLDIASLDEPFDLQSWTGRKALHINVCFEEPKRTDLQLNVSVPEAGKSSTDLFRVRRRAMHSSLSAKLESKSVQFPVVVIGPLQEDEKPFVLEFLQKNSGLPFVAEAPSGLPLTENLLQRRIFCPEKTLPAAFQSGKFRSVIRLGGVPTLRFWRDLEEKFIEIPVLSCSELPFSGLARPSTHLQGFTQLSAIKVQQGAAFDLTADRKAFAKLQELLQKYPRAETSLIRRFAEGAQTQTVYLGNSLPIREWDLVSPDLQAENVWANRGANGIDGQISSFLGWTARAGSAASALIGDLTALYDLASLWISPRLQARPRRVVVVNNFGGQIFRSMFEKDMFMNPHAIGFQKWAEMWNWDFVVSEDGAILQKPWQGHQVIELRPHQESTDLFNQEWKQL